MKCSFSGKEIPLGTGKMYVKKDGTIIWFSSQKAQKNMLKLKRKANKAKWTEEGQMAKQARMATLKHEEEAKEDEVTTKVAKTETKTSKPKKNTSSPKSKK